MGSSENISFHQNNTGDGQNIQGMKIENPTNTVNKGDTSITFDQVAQAMREEIPEGELIEFEAVMIPLEEEAKGEEPTSEQDRITVKERIFAQCEKLAPFVPHIRKTIAAFGEGAFGKLASTALPAPACWIVAGVIEICRDNRRD